ncbi:EscU/YscU/HrcU family type III secretion system export apparatus switch protein [Azospirillum argentinense]|uniref:Flagellar protein FhlB n=1 Tax=Azospirillum argentinense TaxID=2970906 RepID=A0A5B0L2G5_9PROT|nr:EscU/YscU/HrcU family type III secretion system export apparatus switch protein [Azospirillum argentinense]KAA1058479.1 flagellar protein FhlB-like protein [Azospirillum argentinense]
MSEPTPNHRPLPNRPVAVALKYELGDPSLPRVVATGKGHVAEQILELAFANGVKVREDADLVQILSAVDIDSEIPIEAIAAVAEILAYVYRANGTLPPSAEPTAGEAT